MQKFVIWDLLKKRPHPIINNNVVSEPPRVRRACEKIAVPLFAPSHKLGKLQSGISKTLIESAWYLANCSTTSGTLRNFSTPLIFKRCREICTHWVKLLESNNCTELKLSWNWAETEMRLRWDWDETEMRLRWDWDETEMRLRWD